MDFDERSYCLFWLCHYDCRKNLFVISQSFIRKASPADEVGRVCPAIRGSEYKKGRSGQTPNEMCDSPPLISRAPRLPPTALLPHFNHACEGLHARLPLGDQCNLSGCAHVGPETGTPVKILNMSTCSAVHLQMYRWQLGNL